MSSIQDGSVGQVDFITRHGLYTDEQREAIPRLKAEIERLKLRTIRIAWCDQHGLVRGKHVMAHDFLLALRNGIDFQTATLFMDTANNLAAPMFAKHGGGIGVASLCGGPDAILVPDPLTFQVLPWAPGTGWILSEMYLNSGEPVPFDTRALFKRLLAQTRAKGYDWVGGLEVEFYICKLEDRMLKPEQSGWPPDPPKVSAIAHGFQYLTEERQDEIDPILQMLHDNLAQLGLPLRTMEDEWGPGQCEFTFDPTRGVTSADQMVLFRTATKQLCRRHGYHATFMTRPGLPNFFFQRLASAPVAVRSEHRHQPVRQYERQRRRPLAARPAFCGRSAGTRRAGLRVLHADHQRLQALPPQLLRARPHHLGQRKSRGDDSRVRRAGRPRLTYRKPRR